jgi:hypothetical protein
MTTWTVHARDGDLAEAVVGDRLKILPERFSWGACLVPFAWAPWNRLWLVFLGWLAVTVVIQVVDVKVNGALGGVLSFAFLLWFALTAHDLHRWTLERRGWRLVALVEARDPTEAEARFVEKLNASATASAPAPAPAPVGLAPLPPLPPLPPFSGETP